MPRRVDPSLQFLGVRVGPVLVQICPAFAGHLLGNLMDPPDLSLQLIQGQFRATEHLLLKFVQQVPYPPALIHHGSIVHRHLGLLLCDYLRHPATLSLSLPLLRCEPLITPFAFMSATIVCVNIERLCENLFSFGIAIHQLVSATAASASAHGTTTTPCNAAISNNKLRTVGIPALLKASRDACWHWRGAISSLLAWGKDHISANTANVTANAINPCATSSAYSNSMIEIRIRNDQSGANLFWSGDTVLLQTTRD
mmetsp:Transcript_89531/g.232122  ORF Transcript_89531/g.232122 Transcript_89531/m.232122 type:complete len:255 (-) Transcript_89531:495-1259(-)